MLESVTDFFYKIRGLFRVLMFEYTKPLFQLDTVDLAHDIKNSLVYFINTTTKQHLSKNLADLFENKNLIKHFSNNDAAQIGYFYGRWITNHEKI